MTLSAQLARKQLEIIARQFNSEALVCSRTEMPLDMVRKIVGVDEEFLQATAELPGNAVVVAEPGKPLSILVDEGNRVMGFR